MAAVSVYAAPEAPRLSSGKIDYAAIRREAGRVADAAGAQCDEDDQSVAALYAQALGIDTPSPEASFASLGGDSLSYVNANIGLEKLLGRRAPPGWERMSIAKLEAARRTALAIGAKQKPKWRSVESEMVLRVLAVASVVLVHTSWRPALHGGSLVMLTLAGYSLARFQREHLYSGNVGKVIWSSAYRMLIPYYVFLAVVSPFAGTPPSMAWPFLYSGWAFPGEGEAGIFTPFWYIETAFQIILITSALFLIPSVRRLASKSPMLWVACWLSMALIVRTTISPLIPGGNPLHRADYVYFVYILGWASCLADTRIERAIVMALTLALIGTDIGFGLRGSSIITGIAVLLYLPAIKVPAPVARWVMSLAAISFFIYLAHPLVVHLTYLKAAAGVPKGYLAAAAFALSVVVGWLYAQGWPLAVLAVRNAVAKLTGTRFTLLPID